MKEGNDNQSTPPLPDVSAVGDGQVAPPPLVEDSAAQTETAPADPIAAFLARAGAVLALERGMNARSRVKLAAIADELGLSEEEFAQVMEQLLGGESQTAKQKELSREELRQLRRQKSAFGDHVGKTLMALPHGVLTSSMEQMLIATGVREHSLTHEDAQTELHQLAKKLNVRRISHDEAHRHVSELIDYALKPNGVLRPDVRKRILAEASRWGLTPDQVEPILRERTSHIRMGERKEQMRMVMLISASAAVLVGVLCMIAWMAFYNSLPDSPPVAADGEAIDGSASDGTTDGATADGSAAVGTTGTTAPAKKLDVPDWWNEDLASFIANIRLRKPDLEDDLYQLRSPDADKRTGAYRRLLTAAHGPDVSASERAVFAGLLAAAYAVDPSDASASTLREAWMKPVTDASNELPADFLTYEKALWSAEVASTALVQPELSDDRRRDLLNALERTYQTSLDGDLPPRELQRQIDTAVAAAVYKSLTRHATDEILMAVDLHQQLLKRIGRGLPVELSERLAANYLRVVLPVLGDRWDIYEDLIRRAALSEDPLNVVLMLEIFEDVDNADLQNYLGTQLVLRTGIPRTTPRTAEELALAVREALGVGARVRPVDMTERVADWRAAVQKQLDQPLPEADDRNALLQDIVDTARLSTLGMALAQGELAEAEFNALWEAEPPALDKPSTTSAPPRSPRVNTSTLKGLDRQIDSLRGFRRMDKVRRVSYFQSISGYGGTVTDVQPDQAQVIASYLTAAKPVDEHERVLALSDSVLRWRMVRMAVADQIAESRLRTEHLGELLSKALRSDVDIDADGWQVRLRNELLANVARELETEVSLSGDSSDAADRAAEILTSYYRTQAKLRGVATASYNEATSPSQVLEALIQQTAASLSAQGPPAEDRAVLDRLPHDLIAIGYVSESDLASLVHLQRLWQKLLAMELERDAPAGGGRATTPPAADAEHLLQQVAAGEREILRQWMTRNR